MNKKPYSILVLCTGNSARSVMAEALFEHSGHWFTAYSAGSKPVGKVNPFALQQIKLANISGEFSSKSWDVFHNDDAPEIDFVITVCDNAAAESCPDFHGAALKVHWSFPDPAAQKGTNEEIAESFNTVFNALKQRVETLANMPLDTISKQDIAAELTKLAP
jgi:arsenate reductase